MSITAKVEEGHRITLPMDIDWPAGTLVRIERIDDQPPSLMDGLKDFKGIASDLPSDLAANLDRYLHGHPRR
jgi:hypothetical protein